MRAFRHIVSAGLIAMTFASPAIAQSSKPTYLLCSFAKGPAALDVIADEANGSVTTLVQQTGHTERRVAIFTPNAVKWSSPGAFKTSYVLSRIDLSLHRVLLIGASESPDTGKCKLQTAPKRAF